jgi:hypothetical protein
MKPLLPIVFGTAILTVTGCTTAEKQRTETDANGNKVEYVQYTPIGSHIPVKIRKDQLPASARQTTADQSVLQDVQRRSAPPKSPGGS